MTRLLAIAAAVLAAAAVGVASYAAFGTGGGKTVVRQVTVSGGEPTASTTPLSVTGVYNTASKGVVEITATTGSSGYLGSQGQQAQGSGFVYDSSGHVVTNQHVVEGADSLSIKLWNGSTYKATLVGNDASTDLAVLTMDAPSSVLHPLATGNSSAVRVGQAVVAIGSPFGLEETITSGIVSALHREMTAPNNFTITDSIQTDAAINHGNSGGPLLDLTGKVIGVTAQIESDSGGNDGVGFAIPSDTVKSIVSQLISNGDVRHAYLGVGIATAADGVRLTDVRSGTPAEDAGLESGDVITAIDGQAVSDPSALSSAIDAKRPGDTVELTYKRDGNTKTATVKLAERPS